jgi:hypothetical protein
MCRDLSHMDCTERKCNGQLGGTGAGSTEGAVGDEAGDQFHCANNIVFYCIPLLSLFVQYYENLWF